MQNVWRSGERTHAHLLPRLSDCALEIHIRCRGRADRKIAGNCMNAQPATFGLEPDDIELLRLWHAGADTYAIAVELKVDECHVERRLHILLAFERAQCSPSS